jgi:uncharacterized RDD family membrane protein YckC
VGWLAAIIIAVADNILLPAVAGQSLGKMFAGIRIVDRDGSPASVRRIIVRQTLGYLTTVITFGFGFFLAAFSRSGRSLHDLIAGTVVIRGRKEVVS